MPGAAAASMARQIDQVVMSTSAPRSHLSVKYISPLTGERLPRQEMKQHLIDTLKSVGKFFASLTYWIRWYQRMTHYEIQD